MASLIPAFEQAKADRALRGNPFLVYLWMHDNLDVLEYRSVKHSVVEAALAIEDSSIADAIVRLMDRGYLERGCRDNRVWTYRLYYSRRVVPAKPEQKSA